MPPAAPSTRSTLLWTTSWRPRLPLLTMNAVSTIQRQCAGNATKPTTNDAASATAICSAMRVCGDGRRAPLAATVGGSSASTSASVDGDSQRSQRPAACASSTHASATNAIATGTSGSGKACPPWRGRCGTTSTVTSGSATSEPARSARAPKRRIQIDAAIAATNTAAPSHGAACSNVPTPTLARLTTGSASTASRAPRRSPARWLRASDSASTTPRTAAGAPGSIAAAQASVPSIASNVSTASGRERRRVRGSAGMFRMWTRPVDDDPILAAN